MKITRNTIGFILWLLIAIVFGWILTEIMMVSREVYQFNKGLSQRVEIDDINRYTNAILVGTIIHWIIIAIWVF